MSTASGSQPLTHKAILRQQTDLNSKRHRKVCSTPWLLNHVKFVTHDNYLQSWMKFARLSSAKLTSLLICQTLVPSIFCHLQYYHPIMHIHIHCSCYLFFDMGHMTFQNTKKSMSRQPSHQCTPGLLAMVMAQPQSRKQEDPK